MWELKTVQCDRLPTGPETQPLLARYLDHFGLRAGVGPERLLREVIRAFGNLPYENLTKIVRRHAANDAREARRAPDEVLADHVALGTGGTCFSLTATLLCLVRSLGWRAEPLLADRRYGHDTHCALAVWIDGRPHLVDPGYLIVDPIPLDRAGTARVATAFNELVLTPQADGSGLELSTAGPGRETYRLTYKTSPSDEGEFLRAWDASFDWDMMRYPVLTRVRRGEQLYLQGDRFQTRTRGAVCRQEVPVQDLAGRIAAEFGIDRRLADRALGVLKRKGEPYG